MGGGAFAVGDTLSTILIDGGGEKKVSRYAQRTFATSECRMMFYHSYSILYDFLISAFVLNQIKRHMTSVYI